MKISKGLEQGIYVLLMLALQKDHLPVKSQAISQHLEVSDSYLKKILRKLVVAGLIKSSASKDGGYTLQRPIEQISFFDVGQAVDNLGDLQFPDLDLAGKIFPGDAQHILASGKLAEDIFIQAQQEFNAALGTHSISELLEADSIPNGFIDWQQATNTKP